MQSRRRILAEYTEKPLRSEGNAVPSVYKFIQDSAQAIMGNLNENELYEESYLNPAVAAAVFGERDGQIVSAWRYCILQASQDWSLGEFQRLEKLAAGLELIAAGDVSGITAILKADFIQSFSTATRRMLDEEFDISNGESLASYGVPITSNEEESLEFLQTLPVRDVELIAGSVVSGYIKGFQDDNKPIHLKQTVVLSVPAGFERIAASLRQEFLRNDLRMKVWQITTTGHSLQMQYDHKFDWALFLDEETVDKAIGELVGMFSEMYEEASLHSGRAYVMTFGDNRRSPEPNRFSVKPGKDSSRIFMDLQLRRREISNRYIKKEETSYTGVAFPVAEIGDDYREIFMETLLVNTLDSSVYSDIQDALIDALDQADSVRVKGAEGNDTDITVQMHTLKDPEKETSFLNCLSTVNIPLGEVFTSPVLKGTSGTVHVNEAFIAGILYTDLRLVFKDGYIVDYSCANFDSEEKSREFLYNTLIHPHKTLPMGEFAIGTNTLAYRMAMKYGIMNKLPVLIAEKMGPHFAIGDTCFAGGEDHACWNPSSGKEMVARFNEKTALRKENPEQAYTSTHNDVTIPYSSLDSVTAVHPDGTTTEIINEGRYVLPGTEYLNIHLNMEDGK
ncbi:MAG: aminopeptidase [Candidatus Sabulitectum sp.]|nr:aminopeptidase [Candidatus Sabulitectum sp.]